jgi:hypothetical protein
MTKNSLAATAMALLSAFTLAACDSGPPKRVETEIPAWAHSLDVDRVSKRRSYLTTDDGQRFTISRTRQEIGDGLTAQTRSKYRLYVTDVNGIECLWRRAEKVVGCTKPNPALTPGN